MSAGVLAYMMEKRTAAAAVVEATKTEAEAKAPPA